MAVTTPFLHQLPSQFYFRTTDVTGIVTLPEGTEMVMPGDNVTVDVELIVPIAMEEKLRFAIPRKAAAPSAQASSPPSSNNRNGLEPFRQGHGRPCPCDFLKKKRLTNEILQVWCFVSTPEKRSKDKSNATPEYPHPLKAFDHPILDALHARNRVDGQAHRCECARARARFRPIEKIHGQRSPQRRQEEAANSSRCATKASSRYR